MMRFFDWWDRHPFLGPLAIMVCVVIVAGAIIVAAVLGDQQALAERPLTPRDGHGVWLRGYSQGLVDLSRFENDEVVCYVASRPDDVEFTCHWKDKNP